MASNIYLIHVRPIKRNGTLQIKYLLIVSISNKIIESPMGTIDFDFSSIKHIVSQHLIYLLLLILTIL